MTAILDKINQLEFSVTSDSLLDALDSLYHLVSNNLTDEEKILFRSDLYFFYYQNGRYLVHKTFAGGIIFLREPETINKIDIEFLSDINEITASVVYSSEKRNARNTKYKPDAGQIENATLGLVVLFPNFDKHQHYIKVILMALIGKIAQRICETYKRDSWFMEFEKPFDIMLFLDGKLELTYSVEILQSNTV